VRAAAVPTWLHSSDVEGHIHQPARHPVGSLGAVRLRTVQMRPDPHLVAAATVSSLALLSRRHSLKATRKCRSERASRQCRRVARLDVDSIRQDFPALLQDVRPGVPLVYLDSAATSQKPVQVLQKMEEFYKRDNSNVHRGMHTLAIRATDAFEASRKKVASFVNASIVEEIIFTRNATEALNLVAYTWGRANLGPGDEVLLTVMEHHANLVPWQMLAQSTGAKLRFVGLTEDQQFDRAEFESLLSEKTKLVGLQHVSNVLGCINPIEWVAERCRAVGAKVIVDACQSVPHMPVDVQAMGVDFLVASGHKMCGPTGAGFLWGRAELLRETPPFLGGGEMIAEVNLESSTYADIPHKFEAGTPAFAEAVALGAACDYLTGLAEDGKGMEAIHAREEELAAYLWERLSTIPHITLYGPPPDKGRAALLCFNIEGCHPNDIATLVDQDKGVAIRAGHHCCQPLHKHLGVTFSARASAYFYTTNEEIDIAVEAIVEAAQVLRGEIEAEVDVSLADLLA